MEPLNGAQQECKQSKPIDKAWGHPRLQKKSREKLGSEFSFLVFFFFFGVVKVQAVFSADRG